MITSFLWIFIPLLLGIVMLFFQKRNTITLVLGIFLSLTLMMMALILPISNVAMVGSQPFPLSDQINFAGLQIQFSNANRPFIIFFYGYLAFLYCGIPAARTQRNFVPVSLIITTFVITGISIKPAIFGIIFYQPAVLLCAFLLAPPFTKLNKGVLRFLIFQVMGMAFLLLAGWSISGGPESIENAAALSRALLIFWISFSFLFAIFPLHTWVTLVAENANPFLALFVFTSLFGGYTFTLLSIIDSYDWFFGGERISEILRIGGFLLVITGGTGAVFQRNLGRLFGYAIIMEVGFCLSAIAVNNDDLIMMQLPRLFILSLWAMGLSILRTHSQDLAMESVKGLGRQFPFASSAIILSQLALAGVPLLAGFPFLLVLLNQISNNSTVLVFWIFVCVLGFLLGSLRVLSILVANQDEQPVKVKEDNLQLSILTAGIIILFLMGLFPHWVILVVLNLLENVGILKL